MMLQLHTATASYRLMPAISINAPIPSHLCDKFAMCFSPGVIEVEQDASGQKSVRVANPRKDTLSREILRHAELRDLVTLGRQRDHYICESHELASFAHIAALTAYQSIIRQHPICRSI